MKVREDHCPYCNSTDIEYGSLELTLDQQLYRRCFCPNCEHKFEQWYELSFLGVNIGDELTTWVDKDQDI